MFNPNLLPEMSSRKKIVLLIEDDMDDAEMIIYSLRNLEDIQIIHIDDSVRAMQYLFEDGHPHPLLILLDIKMPKVDGIQILRRLKADAEMRNIPVAMMISSKEGKDYVQSFHLIPDAYISKPVDEKSFLSVFKHTQSRPKTFVPVENLKLKNRYWPNIGDW
jgi:two-component system response regulator